MKNRYDIIVIGGGHAGVEASHICAKMGLKTLLITHLIDNIALASCNPAIGGLGKGHLTKEVDSLGGLMGAITDISGLQYRILNASKGPAVRGTRVQIDMDLYRKYARDLLFQMQNLSIIQANATKILSNDSEVIGVEISIKKQFLAKKVILTAGTFLNGLIHIGENKSKNGRAGEIASNELSQSLQSLGIPLSRLKTGTCPRIIGNSIDFSNLQKHYGDAYIDLENEKANINKKQTPYFSLLTYDFIHNKKNNVISQFLLDRISHDRFLPKELPCFVTYTNANTHKIIKDNFYRAPLFTGQIQGIGPRYCPSIEDKVNRFSDKERHQLFLEPQTYSASEYYINGLTTSLPYQVQEEVVRSIHGLENAQITRYGYAIEYDYSQPTNLYHTLESRIIKNLYLAGQVNGTTGYEEAAAQGIMAGINASLSILAQHGQSKRESLILQRDESYIAVMIDDLVTKGTNEPYRVFTSRAEYRLLLREDNACFRLLPYAKELGLLDSRIIDSLQKDMDDIQANLALLESCFTPNKKNLDSLARVNEEPFNNPCNLSLILGRDSMNADKMKELHASLAPLSNRALEQLRITAKYQDYIRKQEEQIIRSKKALSLEIPNCFVYERISGLSLEVIEKLSLHKPRNLQEASLISGVTPASLEVLELNIIMHNRQKQIL